MNVTHLLRLLHLGFASEPRKASCEHICFPFPCKSHICRQPPSQQASHTHQASQPGRFSFLELIHDGKRCESTQWLELNDVSLQHKALLPLLPPLENDVIILKNGLVLRQAVRVNSMTGVGLVLMHSLITKTRGLRNDWVSAGFTTCGIQSMLLEIIHEIFKWQNKWCKESGISLVQHLHIRKSQPGYVTNHLGHQHHATGRA